MLSELKRRQKDRQTPFDRSLRLTRERRKSKNDSQMSRFLTCSLPAARGHTHKQHTLQTDSHRIRRTYFQRYVEEERSYGQKNGDGAKNIKYE